MADTYPRYFLKIADGPEQEVTKEQYIAAERACGFISQYGPDSTATASFGKGPFSGRQEYSVGRAVSR